MPIPDFDQAFKELDGLLSQPGAYPGVNTCWEILKQHLLRKREGDAAIKTLKHLDYTYCGGEQWKPPLGTAPDYIVADRKPEPISISVPLCEPATRYVQALNGCEYLLTHFFSGPPDPLSDKRLIVKWLAQAYLSDPAATERHDA
jgi:hypothetical protein